MKPGVITSVQADVKNRKRYCIFLDEEFAFSVHEDVLVKYNLFKGKEIDQKQMAEIVREDEWHKAYLAALRYIGIRPRTEAQVLRYLSDKGFQRDVAEEVCERCRSQGYLDDRQFARQWVQERLLHKPRGKRALRAELQQKGITQEAMEESLASIGMEDEMEAARSYIRKKCRKKTRWNETEERKLLQGLMRLGFGMNVVQRIRQELRQGEFSDLIDSSLLEDEPDSHE